MQYGIAKELSEKLLNALLPGCVRAEVVGSVKRADKLDVHDIEILCIANPKAPRILFGQKDRFKNLLESTLAYMQANRLIGLPKLNGDRLKKFPILIGCTEEVNPFYLELYIVQPETWAIQNVIRTGPSEFSHHFVTNVAHGGLLPNCYSYMKGETRI